MDPFPRWLLAAALALAAIPASATFHLWSMDELYTNADGSVQFLELTALAGGQEFVGGHTLRVAQGSTVHTFTIPSNLPGDTSGRRMLFGTQSFAALGVVAPDFIVPDGFFLAGNATVTFAEGADTWSYGPLPTDGVRSLDRDGSTATNSPQDFAGRTGSVQPAAAPAGRDYQGLWWRSPAASEAGWGINITHQGDILFATWFTYDSDGSGMWLVMPNGAKSAPDTYGGPLYRTTGPAFSSPAFDPARVTVTQVGTATFAFGDADNGTFTYTVNGVTQAKPITREVFASPVPTCTQTGTPQATNFQDLWWHAPANSESGWGINITHQADTIFATWFTYAADGKGMWVVMANGARSAPGTYSGDLFRTTGPAFDAVPWDPARVVATQVGRGTFTFTDAANGTFAYTLDGVTQTKAITREEFATPATVCK